MRERLAFPIALSLLFALALARPGAAGSAMGVAWTSVHGSPAATGSKLDAVSCPTESTCVAVWGSILRTSDGGKTWDREKTPRALTRGPGARNLTDVACPSQRRCVAILWGRDVLVTASGGAKWTTHRLPRRVAGLAALDCPSDKECVGVGAGADGRAAIVISRDGGNHWSRSWVGHSDWQLEDVSCPAVAACTAVGGTARRGLILATTDAGKHWSRKEAPARVSDVSSVSCPRPGDCVALAYLRHRDAALATARHGRWRIRGSDGGAGSDLSCGGLHWCVAVGTAAGSGARGGAAFSRDRARDWKRSQVPAGVGPIFGVACRSRLDCVAVGVGSGYGAVLWSSDGGRTWRAGRVRSRAGRPTYPRVQGAPPTAQLLPRRRHAYHGRRLRHDHGLLQPSQPAGLIALSVPPGSGLTETSPVVRPLLAGASESAQTVHVAAAARAAGTYRVTPMSFQGSSEDLAPHIRRPVKADTYVASILAWVVAGPPLNLHMAVLEACRLQLSGRPQPVPADRLSPTPPSDVASIAWVAS